MRWATDNTGEIMRRAKETVRSIYDEVRLVRDDDYRRKLAAHALQSEHEARLRAMVKLSESEASIAIPDTAFDSDPWLLNVANGTLDLRTGTLRPHRREDLITRTSAVEYHPQATAPIWQAFLARVLPKGEVREFVQRAVGYSLTGDVGEQILLILWGSGANGKSTFLETVRATLGDYAMHTPGDTLLARRDTGIPNDIARLRGARFITCVETEEGHRLAESRVKQLTGGDTISARFMRGEWFEFRLVGKLWLATNWRPEVRGTDEAIWRRIRLVPFTEFIPESERDPTLPTKLREELPGILAWAVEGCLKWQATGLAAPEEVANATAEYRAEEDSLGAFLEQHCVVDATAITSAQALYRVYQATCAERGEEPLSQKKWGARMKARGFRNDRHGAENRSHWFGVGLRSQWVGPRANPSTDPNPNSPIAS